MNTEAASVMSNENQHTATLPYTDSVTLEVKMDIVMPQPAISTTVHSVTVAAALESVLNCLRVADTVSFQVAD